MPTIDPTAPTVTPSTQSLSNTFAESLTGSGDSGGSSKSGIGGLNDFLLLLTTQMKNQDPLNPQDSTEFVAQLASFSSVEQQINTNTNLKTLIGEMSGNDIADLASYIGLDVTATGAGFRYDASPVAIDVPGNLDAERVSVEITDTNGQLVAIVPATPAGGSVTWDGRDINGQEVIASRYNATFVYKTGEKEEDATRVDAEGNGRVTEARQEGDDTILTLDNGAEIKASTVTAVQS